MPKAKPLELLSGTRGSWSIKQRTWTLRMYRDRQRQWRWRLIAGNGRIVACSGEGYQRRRDITAITRKIFAWFYQKA